MFSISTSMSYCERRVVPLKAMCSRKCAAPLFLAVS